MWGLISGLFMSYNPYHYMSSSEKAQFRSDFPKIVIGFIIIAVVVNAIGVLINYIKCKIKDNELKRQNERERAIKERYKAKHNDRSE